MRWPLAVGGALALMGAAYLGLRPRLTRPVLRVGFVVRSGSVEDEEMMAGVRLALDERDERGGRFRVAAVPNPDAASKALIKIWMPGLYSMPEAWVDVQNVTLIAPDVEAQADVLLAWAKARGLRRITLPTSSRLLAIDGDNSNSSYGALGVRATVAHVMEQRVPASDLAWLWDSESHRDTAGLCRRTAEARPDLVVLEDAPGLAGVIRAAGYGGPIFVSKFNRADLNGLDGCLAVLAPLKAPPPGFRRPSPFAYAGHFAMLRLLDQMDHNPDDGVDLTCLPSVFDELRGEARVYEFRGGRFRLPR